VWGECSRRFASVKKGKENNKKNNTETKIEVQTLFLMSYENVRLENGNANCNSVFQSNGKTKNENTVEIPLSM